MTDLRKMMLEELERRNYAQTTIACYIQTIEDFARHFHCPPDQLTPEHIRTSAHPRVPSVFVPREKAGCIHRDATTCGSAVPLHADDQESLERGRDPLSEEDALPAQHPEPGRSGPPHRLVPDSVSSHGVDDALMARGYGAQSWLACKFPISTADAW